MAKKNLQNTKINTKFVNIINNEDNLALIENTYIMINIKKYSLLVIIKDAD